MIFAVDFDGTIVENAYPDIGLLRPGAVEALRLMRAHGHTIIIWTCRYGQELEDMVHFLDGHRIPYDYVNDCPKMPLPVRKIYADYYIDDRSVSSWTWDDVMRILDSGKVV